MQQRPLGRTGLLVSRLALGTMTWGRDTAPDDAERTKDGLREKNEGSRDLGMDGTWVIHPQQAEIANAVFTPDDDQITATKRSLEVYHRLGGGSIADGLVDSPANIVHLLEVDHLHHQSHLAH